MEAGSITFSTVLDNKQLYKELNSLTKKIEKSERTIADLTVKRDQAREKSLFDSGVLDRENAKLQEMKDRLAEIQTLSKDKSIDLETRENYAAQIPALKQDVEDQRTRVRGLQTEWNKTEAAAERYDAKLSEAEQELSRQKEEAGYLVQQIDETAQKQGKFSNATATAGKAMDRLANRIKGLAVRAFVFSMIAKALRSIRDLTMRYIKTNGEARQAIAQMKGALLTLAQPLIEVVIPAFTLLVNVLTRIISIVAGFVSSLFGKTAKQSKDGAKALYEEANAIEGVGSAAEEAAGSLAGFDEINSIQTENAKGAGGAGASDSEILPDFDFTPGKYKDMIDELMVYLSGALLVIGAILLFSGANIPLGLGLIALGAAVLASEIRENWGAIDGKVRDAVNRMLIILGGALLVIGVILCFTGANIPLGIGLMVVGAAMLGTAVALNWGCMDKELRATLTNTLVILGGFLLVLGAILAFSGANIPLGIGLMAVGAVALATAAKLNWGELNDEIRKTITDIFTILGISLLVLGAIIAFSGANIPLGIGLMAMGAVSLAAAASLDWEYISSHIKEIVTTITALLGAGLLALGAVLCFSGGSLPLGIGLMIVGAGSLAAAAVLNWDSLITILQGKIGAVTAIVSTALLALGVILCFSGVGLPLGIALIAAGAVGLVSVTALNWNAMLDKIKETVGNIKSWWSGNVAKYLTLDYWKGLGADIINGFKQGIKDKWDGLVSWFNEKWNGLFGNKKVSVGVETHGSSTTPAPSRASRVSMQSIPDITSYNIPALAQGAVIPPNREFLAVLGDQRSGNNLELPEGLLRQIVREESGGSGDVAALLQQILAAVKAGQIIMVDGAVFGRTAIRTINSANTAAGKQLLLI